MRAIAKLLTGLFVVAGIALGLEVSGVILVDKMTGKPGYLGSPWRR